MRWTVFVGLVMAASATAQEATTKAYASDDGVYTLHLPATWTVTKQENKSSKLAFEITAPGKTWIAIRVNDIVGGVVTPIGQAHYEQPLMKKQYEADSAVVGTTPDPHVVVQWAGKGKERYVSLRVFRRKAAHGLHITFTCRRHDFDKRRAAFFAIARSFAAKVERAPPEPTEGYKRDERDGVVYLYGKGVTKAACATLRRTIHTAVKTFERDHGPVERPADEPLLIIVHKHVAEHEPYWEGAGTVPIFPLSSARRIFVVPLGKKDPRRAELARDLYGIMFEEKYGLAKPGWVASGLASLLYYELWTGKKLPYLPASFLESFGGISFAPSDVASLRDLDGDSWSWHATAYAFYFLRGPQPVKTAFAAFLSDFAKTGDGFGALKRHIHPLDPTPLRSTSSSASTPSRGRGKGSADVRSGLRSRRDTVSR